MKTLENSAEFKEHRLGFALKSVLSGLKCGFEGGKVRSPNRIWDTGIEVGS